ncbi:hypothetical protein X777_02707 [Ooceraea biroi]|uniref:Uncharacterized protein n=1 Tax=Ooceraea biroi TaxID=2015173 RepID=A0A026WMG2_OOCBI|nr:hypothetical protein X777_02707 [Ooceraea biroi]
MATTGSNAAANAGNETNGNSNVPQWKRDLIQRRRQQSKVLANNGASVKLRSAVIGASSACATAADGLAEQNAGAAQEHRAVTGALRAARSTTATSSEDTVAVLGVGGGSASLPSCPPSHPARRPPTSGATSVGAVATAADFAPSVAHNMRLEADATLCMDAEDVNGAPAKFADTSERKSSDCVAGDESEDAAPRMDGKSARSVARMSDGDDGAPPQHNEVRAIGTARGKDASVPFGAANPLRMLRESRAVPASRASSDDATESDSSEELQYGPGIVNRLKSKYLNLTRRETSKCRTSVQRFRRAASLEDLLDRDDDEASAHERTTASRKYTKRSGDSTSSGSGGVVGTKTDRYRNVCRGNDSMKRARSVETLMRYNSATADETRQAPLARPTTNGVRQEPVNDHIILVDRTSIKIESRLGELERPKPVNKPKRIKPVLAETERPPPDLVKTTMRIFEVSAKKLKPKGEVAAKVATFKTINDTFKAQNQKKLMMSKPPVQPKPFINGGARPGIPGSPKKIVLPHKPTAELIETQDGKQEYHMDGVITDSIVQSVSSVVSKFQQIEKSHSPSPSPEPTCYKLKFSPANSPEPPAQIAKPAKSSHLEIAVKSPPITPVVSPRVSSPRLQSPPSPLKGTQSPSSPVKDSTRIQIPSPLHKPPLPSPVRESSKAESDSTKTLRSQTEKELPKTKIERSRETRLPEPSTNAERKEEAKPSRVAPGDDEDKEVDKEVVDGPRSISKMALDNIGRAGTTMQFNFGDEPTREKSYLPGMKQNGQKSADERAPETDDRCTKTELGGKTSLSGVANDVTSSETTSRSQERLEPESEERLDDSREDPEEKQIVSESKPIGAICSLGLIKPVPTITTATTTTSYSQSNNEAKTNKCQQKSEFSPPQKQIGIIRPLVSTKAQHPQQNLSNRELEKNLINRVKSIEQPTKVVVSLKSADEIQPTKKTSASGGGGGGGGGGGLWDTKPWNQQNNTMVFNFSNRKDVPDYIENDGLIIRRKREKPKVRHQLHSFQECEKRQRLA